MCALSVISLKSVMRKVCSEFKIPKNIYVLCHYIKCFLQSKIQTMSSSQKKEIVIAVGTSNSSKIQAVVDALKKCNFVGDSNNDDNNNNNNSSENKFNVIGVSGIDSKVSPQPFSASETRLGAMNRARGALEKCQEAEFGIGLEGGIELVEDFFVGAAGETSSKSFYVVGWICVIHRSANTICFGSSSRVQLPKLFAEKLEIVENVSDEEKMQHGGSRFRSKRELAQVIDEVSKQQDLRSSLGVEGLLSNGGILRSDAYSQGIIFAFAKFLSPKGIW